MHVKPQPAPFLPAHQTPSTVTSIETAIAGMTCSLMVRSRSGAGRTALAADEEQAVSDPEIGA